MKNCPIICHHPWRIHGAAIYGHMDPINIPQMGHKPGENPLVFSGFL